VRFVIKIGVKKMTIRRKVKRVVDKDTFETYTKVNGTNFVRIAGMDGAELHTKLGRQQKDQIKRKIQGKVVTLQPVGRSYNRVVAKVRKDRRLLK
jgi:endonuclease YncB( thermonuclease family)